MYRRAAKEPGLVERNAPELRPDVFDRFLFDRTVPGKIVLIVATGWVVGFVPATIAALLGSLLYVMGGATVNAIGHVVGSRPHPNTATNLRWLTFFTVGESLHNNHHQFPLRARFSERRWEIDPGMDRDQDAAPVRPRPAAHRAHRVLSGTGQMAALDHLRICDFTGQLAGAGATRWLATFGAEVIRIEDPVRKGRWDILRGSPPFKDERRGVEYGSGFQNHNIEKLGITLNLRTEQGRELLTQLVPLCDAVTENFAAGVLERMGFGYERLCELRPDIVYVSNCGFGQTGPYARYKSWGPIAQAVSGLTHTSGLPDQPPAGWGYSYMDHTGGYYMAIALLMALWHRHHTGEGQWVDLSCSEAGGNLHGAGLLDWSVNGRPLRGSGEPHSNRNTAPPMAPHGIYPCRGEDNWVAIACRDDADWAALVEVVDEEWARDAGYVDAGGPARRPGRPGRPARRVDRRSAPAGTSPSRCGPRGSPAAPVTRPRERIDGDLNTAGWGLWPMVEHTAMGGVRVDGQPVHLSRHDWRMERGAPLLGEHNDYVFGELLGLSDDEPSPTCEPRG